MNIILISKKAEQDLENINSRINIYNPQATNDLLDKILDKFETLANFSVVCQDIIDGLLLA